MCCAVSLAGAIVTRAFNSVLAVVLSFLCRLVPLQKLIVLAVT